MPATQAPYSQYFDKNGQPLDAGYVWFGLPNENPKTSPVNVYWDADLTQPALQPIRTLAGYLARNGSPAQVFTDGAYSQIVENKRFEMVYYAANSADYSDLPIRVAVITATDGQTLVNLPFAYTRGNNSLAIYLNGILLIKDRDYTETSTTSVTMIRPLKVGPGGADEVTAIGGRLINAASAIDAVSAAALAAGSGAGLVGYDATLVFPTGTVGERLQAFLSVKDFGAKGDGVTDDTAAITAAHATGRVIFYPAGTYLFSRFSFSSGGMIGEGRDQSVLLSTDTTGNDAITYLGSYSTPKSTPLFQDISIFGPSAAGVTTKAGGAGLAFNPGSSEVGYFNLSNVVFAFWPRCVDIRRGAYWSMTNCQFLAYTLAGVRVANEDNADSGDATIMGCLFNTGGSTGEGVLHRSSGGLKIVGNKFLGGNTGYSLQFEATSPTGVLVFTGNSVENMVGQCMSFSRASGSSAFANVTISGNEFAVGPTGIQTDASDFMQQVSITGNVFNLVGSGLGYGINLVAVDDFVISGNTFKGNGGTPAGILIDSTCANGKIGINSYATLTSAVVNNSATTWVQYDPISGGGEGRTVSVDAITTINATNLGLLAGDVLVAQGYATVGDGGGGVLRVVASGTADLVRTFNIGGGLFAVRPADVVLTPEMAGAFPAAADSTAGITRWLVAGGGRVNDGVYNIDDITVTNRVTVTGSPDAIFKRRNTTSANSTMILFAAGSEDSVWDGPTVDGGRNTTVKAAFSAANPSYPGYWSGWFGVQSQAARINYRGKFTNHVSKPCWFAGDDNVVDIVCEDHGDAALFGYVWFTNGAVSRITPRPSGNGARRQSVKCISIRADNDGVAQVIQHAIDVQAAAGGSYDLRCYDLDGDTAGVSSYVSGITIENCEDCNIPLTLAHNFVSDTLQHLGVSLLGNTRCPLSVVSVQSIAGLAYEQNGNTDCPAALVMLDGAYRATTACPVGNDGSYGVSEYAGVWNVSRNSKSSQSNVRSDILGGTVQRFTRGAILRTASVSLDSVNIVGNLRDGVRIEESVFADHFTGAIAQKNRLTKLTNCVITCNGRAGISAESFKNLILTGTRCYNNGQDTTLSTSVRVGLTASTGDLLQATGCQFGDDQSWTDTAACTYEPQASVNNFLTVYMQSTLGRLTVGQWITLVNGTGSGNVTAKVYATGVNDDVTLQTTGAVTLSATGNTTALTGTWSGSGTTLTGVGTAATTEIIGVTYVTNGTHWRRVVKATSATSIIIDTAFPSPLSGATLSKLLVNVSGIPSQQEGARVFSGVNKHFLGPDNTYDGNVLSRTVISDPLEAMTGSAYFRKASVNPAALTVNLQTAIPARHRLSGVALNNDVAISGGGSTSYEVRLTNSGGTTLQTIATLVGLTKNTKVTAAVAASNQVADGNLLRVVFAGGAPTAGTITCEARYVVDGPQALPDAP